MTIAVRDLHVRYGDVHAVRGVDLDVAAGEVVAVLGPNGAGKTSVIEHLEGFRPRAGGTVTVLGEDPARAGREWRGRLGVVLQESTIEPQLTVREVVTLYAGYHAAPLPVEETLALAGLEGLEDRLGGRLSRGQQRRVDVALALAGDPELIFLDEPTTGFDPEARLATWAMIERLSERGRTIVLTTHNLEEAERLADRIVVLVAGRVVADGDLRSLRGDESRVSWEHEGRRITERTRDPVALVASLAGQDVRHLEVRPPSLEDVYLELVR